MMIVSKGMEIDNFYIPPFTLESGDIMVIQAPNGLPFSGILFRLVDIFTGLEKHDAVEVLVNLHFVSHITEKGWRRIFRPLTVGRYIKKSANPDNDLVQQVYKEHWMKPDTTISRLAGTPRKILSLLSVLSWTDKIVFDLMGIDPLGGQKIFNLAKKQIGQSGAAILIDSHYDFKNECTKFIVVEQRE